MISIFTFQLSLLRLYNEIVRGSDSVEIIKQKTRLIFDQYSDSERTYIENLSSTMDNVFIYLNEEKRRICLPTGMEKSIGKLFPKHKLIDESNEYWNYDRIPVIEHSMKPRNRLQEDFINYALDKISKKMKIGGILSPGTGKLEPISRKIPAPNSQGFIRMGDIRVGDRIFGSNGKIINVTGVFPQGVQDIYKITFNDGRYALCGLDHLWTVTTAWPSKPRTIRTRDMLEDYRSFVPHIARDNIRTGSKREPYLYKYRVQLLSSPVEYLHRDVPIHPYVLGAFIGNGCCTLGPLSLSSGDSFVPSKVAKLCGFTTRKREDCYTYEFFKDGKKVRTKDFFKNVPEMINCYSRDKKIPEVYCYNDPMIRLELLRGLMDTDGSICNHDGIRYNVSYSSCSKKLLEQIQEIIRGFGYSSTIGSPDKREEKYIEGFHASVSIRVPQKFKQEIFTHPKKLSIARNAALVKDFQQPFKYLIIKDIKLVKREEAQCISVDAPDQLYLTEQFIVTHNTFMACYCAIAARLKTLIIAPTSSIRQQWADTLTGMFKVDPSKVLIARRPEDFIHNAQDAWFVITIHPTLASLNNRYDMEEVLQNCRFGFKVIDEVQMWFQNIINIDGCCNIPNNLYLTGTFGRSGEAENNLYQEMFGDINIFREQEKKPTFWNRKPGNIYGMKPHTICKMFWGHSHLTKEELQKVTNKWRYSERSDKWTRIGIGIATYSKLIFPEDGTVTPFMKQLIKVIRRAFKECDYGKTLILMPSIASAEMFKSIMKEMYPDLTVGTIHSYNSFAENENNKKTCDCLVSTPQSAGTGFDYKDLSRLIVAAQYSSWILTSQIRGRCRVRDDGRPTYMYDMVDADIPQLRRWANKRAAILRKECLEFKVIDIDV